MTSRSQTGRAHLLLVSATPGSAGGALGVITLEGHFHLPSLSPANNSRTSICAPADIIEVRVLPANPPHTRPAR
jgi:hypothetical protein